FPEFIAAATMVPFYWFLLFVVLPGSLILSTGFFIILELPSGFFSNLFGGPAVCSEKKLVGHLSIEIEGFNFTRNGNTNCSVRGVCDNRRRITIWFDDLELLTYVYDPEVGIHQLQRDMLYNRPPHRLLYTLRLVIDHRTRQERNAGKR
ncbi:hypothetical protein PMAYCL1PPCAC_33022, partial [Pristionchus mayeri]